MSASTDWIEDLHLVDHHCHGIVPGTVDRAGFEDMITESDRPAPPRTTHFDSQVGFAIRRECAPVLGLEPFATPEDYIARRAELGGEEVGRRLLRAARIGDFVIETGHGADLVLGPAQMGEWGEGGYAEIVRLERLGEQVAEDGHEGDYPEVFAARLDEALRAAVGVKSIAAYRGGLALDPRRPSTDEVVAAVRRWRADAPAGTALRMTDPVLIRAGIWAAIERSVPIQFHIGYGDPDVDLHRCNPLLLTELIRTAWGSGASFALLHCYPFHREAGYLAQVFEHVYCDVGLAINYTGAQSAQVIAESLELTPFHKALFSSDAWGAAELYHLGALLFRRGMARTLARWNAEQGWPMEELQRVARMIGSDNAVRLYGLDRVPTTSAGRAS